MNKMRLLSSIFTILFAGTAFGSDCKMNLFTWSEYIDPEIITEFETKNDCKVIVDLFEDNESMLAKLESGGDSLYDVIIPSDYIVSALRAKKLLASLEKKNIPNLVNIDPKFINPSYDPGNEFTLPYQWGTVGIYLRKKPGKEIEESWSILFDPKKQYGSFVMIDSMRESMGGALKYLGHSLNTVDPKVLVQARDLLIEAKKRAVGFESGVGGKNKVLAKGVDVAIAYNGDAVRGMNEDPDTYYFIPKEGGEIWVDNMAIPRNAPNKVMAEKFINFILDPQIGAKLSNFNQYATPNKESLKFISEEDRNNKAIYPAPETMSKLELLQDLGQNTRLFDEIWTQVKSR
jgi:spermidine/putrescine transport system substrate-binding protein